MTAIRSPWFFTVTAFVLTLCCAYVAELRLGGAW